ncbi:MAG: tRNA pseudouridine(55) synthase TruB [Actinomycetia bacterium]|nr:tRNA pseudouridine(55) synthase TruB [Actinomycetes bacterium]
MSKARRGATALAGVLLVDKPAGCSSHDVIARLRRLTGEGRIGHAGTLDPAATGLLVVLFGPATSLSEILHAEDKRYEATICFGAQTSTDDCEGAVIASSEPASELFDPVVAQALLDRFLGRQEQLPPRFSALKVAGVAAYKAARKGRDLDLQPRSIEVFAARLLSCDACARSWTVDFQVSKGTYIRALARDIGLAAGTHAHLSALRRTRSGDLSLSDAHTLQEIEQKAGDGPLAVAELFCEPASLPPSRRVAGPRHPAAVVALGVFDGVHRGHQALLSAARAEALRRGCPLVALCFDPLPEQVIRPQSAPALLTDVAQRIALLKRYGADQVEVIDFSPALAQSSAEFFATQVLPSRAAPVQLFVGENFRFGAGAQGDVRMLAEALDCPVTAVVLAADEDGEVISSTRVRALLGASRLEAASELMGHTLDLTGTVIQGSAQGRELGYPTANLQLDAARWPLCFSEGVYAALARLGGVSYTAGLFIGQARSAGFEQDRLQVEAHLLDYEGPEFYGQDLTVSVLHFISTLRRFETPEGLSEAIGAWLFAIRQTTIVE